MEWFGIIKIKNVTALIQKFKIKENVNVQAICMITEKEIAWSVHFQASGMMKKKLA